MKVMCIKEPGNKLGYYTNKPYVIRTGSIYTVLDFVKDEHGADGYRLVEDIEHTYNANLFAPCSEIDELELVNEKQFCQ